MLAVTGATGHVGNVLVRELLSRGRKVRCIVQPQVSTAPLAGLNVELVEADLLDSPSLCRALEGATSLFHLAGMISIMPGQRRKLEAVNVLGTRHVIEASLQAKVDRLIYTSSVHALAEPPCGTIIDETARLDPKQVCGDYAKSKAVATREVLEAAAVLDTVVVIPSGVLGPYDFQPSQMGQFILDYLQGKIPFSIGGAYNFVDVRDLASGLISAFQRGKRGECYLLSGSVLSIEELFSTLSSLSTVEQPSYKLPNWLLKALSFLAVPYYKIHPGKQRKLTPYAISVLNSNCQMSHAKARRELGFTARPLAETLHDTVAWFREQGFCHD